MDVDKLNQVLDTLAARFGATGSALWHAYVHWTFFNALIWMFCGAGVFGALAIAAFRYQTDANDPELQIIPIVVGWVALFIAVCFVAGNVADLIWPQVSALTALLNGTRK